MATLQQMNPLILALLGVDERKLAQLQAVINSPQLMAVNDPAQAGLLASMLASANNYSVAAQPVLGSAVVAGVPTPALGTPATMGVNSVGMGMQELNLNQHYEPATVMSQQQQQQPVGLLSLPPGLGHTNVYQPVDESHLRLPSHSFMEPVTPLNAVRSIASHASTVTSPYGTASAYSASSGSGSGTNSSSSSPLLRSALSAQQTATTSLLSMPPLPPLAPSVIGTPTNSPRMVSRSHTQPHGLLDPVDSHSPMQRQRLFSHPALPPLSSSTPTMSRILPQPCLSSNEHSSQLLQQHDLSPSHAYSAHLYQPQQPLSRKRSYSTTVADSDAIDMTRHRFVLPPHIVQQAQVEYVRDRAPSAADLSVKAEQVGQYDSQWSLQQPSQQQQQQCERPQFVLEHEMEMRKRLAEAAWKQEAETLYHQQPALPHNESELLLHFDHPTHPVNDYSSHPTY